MSDQTAETAEVADTITEWGFLYNGEPRWSFDRDPWTRHKAVFYRRDAELWGVSAWVGGLVKRERTIYHDRVGEWSPEVATPPEEASS